MMNEEPGIPIPEEKKSEMGEAEQLEKITEEIKKIIEDDEIPAKKQSEIASILLRAIAIERKSSFSGPIPPPDILKGYNSVIKEGAERIMRMAELQSAHRIQLEDLAIREGIKQSKRGQNYGFILGLVGLGLSAILASLGHEPTAIALATPTIVGLVAVFVYGKRAQSKNLSEKS